MQGLNRIEVIGNLGADPELKHTTKGTAVLNLRIAATDRTKRGDEWIDDTQWFTCVLFGRRAEALADMLRKGSRVYASGRFVTREYEGRDGTKQRTGEVQVSELLLLDGRADGGSAGHDDRARSATKATTRHAADEGGSNEIPF